MPRSLFAQKNSQSVFFQLIFLAKETFARDSLSLCTFITLSILKNNQFELMRFSSFDNTPSQRQFASPIHPAVREKKGILKQGSGRGTGILQYYNPLLLKLFFPIASHSEKFSISHCPTGILAKASHSLSLCTFITQSISKNTEFARMRVDLIDRNSVSKAIRYFHSCFCRKEGGRPRSRGLGGGPHSAGVSAAVVWRPGDLWDPRKPQ